MPADVRKQQEQDPLESLLSILSGVVTVGDAVIERTSSTPESSRSLSDSGSTETRNSLANPQSQGSSSNSMARTPFSLVMHLLNPEEPKRIISNLAKGLFPKGGPQYKEGMTGKEMAAEGVRTFEDSTLLGMGALRGVPSDMAMRGLKELKDSMVAVRQRLPNLIDSGALSRTDEGPFKVALSDIESHLSDPKIKALTEVAGQARQKLLGFQMKLDTLKLKDPQAFDLLPPSEVEDMIAKLKQPLAKARLKLDTLVYKKTRKAIEDRAAEMAARDAKIKALTRKGQEQAMGPNVKLLDPEKNWNKNAEKFSKEFEALYEAQAVRAQQIDDLRQELAKLKHLRVIENDPGGVADGLHQLSEKELRIREAIYELQQQSLELAREMHKPTTANPKADVLDFLKGPKGGKPKK